MRSADWLVVPIRRVRGADLLEPPDLLLLARSLVAEVGPGLEADPVAILERLLIFWQLEADQALRALGRDALADLLPTLFERADFTDTLLFDFLTMHGVDGRAAHNQVVEAMTGQQLRTTWLTLIRAGATTTPAGPDQH